MQSRLFLLLIAIFSCSYLVNGQGGCSPPSLQTFSSSGVVGPVSISWTADCIARTITLTATATTNNWVGFGLGGTQNSMVNHNVVQGIFTGGSSSVLHRSATGFFTPTTISAAAITNAVASFANGNMTVTWARNWTITGVPGTRDIVPGPMNVIAAIGFNTNMDGGHPGSPSRASSQLTLIPGNSPTSTTGAATTGPAVVSEGCQAPDQTITQTLDLSPTVKLAWTISCANQEISFDFSGTSTSSGWVALGLNQNSATMTNADIYMAHQNSGTFVVENRFATTQSTPSLDSAQGLTGVSGSISGNTFSVKFTRKLNTNSGTDVPIGNGNLNLIYAFGPSQDPTAYHGSTNRVQFGTINFFSGAVGGAGADGRAAHGILMLFAWSMFIIISNSIARYLKDIGNLWFIIHRALGFLVLILTVASFILIVALLGDYRARAHHIIGIFIVVGTIAQPILGILADKLYDPNRTSAPIFPDKVHQINGIVTSLLGVVNMWLGFCNYGANRVVWALYSVWIAIVIVLSVIANFTVGQVDHSGGAGGSGEGGKPHVDEGKLRKAKIIVTVIGVGAFVFNIVIAALIPTLEKENLCSGPA